MSIYWVVLFIAVITEVAWALSLKWVQVSGGWAAMTVAGVLTITNMVMLSYAMRGIPVGTAYGVWTGLGAVGVCVMGIVLFKDPVFFSRLFFMGLIVLGVVGLKWVSPA